MSLAGERTNVAPCFTSSLERFQINKIVHKLCGFFPTFTVGTIIKLHKFGTEILHKTKQCRHNPEHASERVLHDVWNAALLTSVNNTQHESQK